MLIQPQHKGDAFKGPAKGQCLNCMDEQEYDLTVPANRGDLINVIEVVTPKADVRLTASIGRNRPTAAFSESRFLVDGEDFGVNEGNTLHRCALVMQSPCSSYAQ